MTVLYLDCAATTPVDPRVAEEVMRFFTDEFGNAGSRTHDWGSRAKRALQSAREQVAVAAQARPEEVIFTSGATEADNLALLGLADEGKRTGRRHILSSATEHKAVLEPFERLASEGFDVELLRPDQSGILSPETVLGHVREDTLLVSLMLVNNETGVVQDVGAVAQGLIDTPTYFHVDAVQGFAKPIQQDLTLVDLVAVSGHKVAGPKGIGALIVRRRGWKRVPLSPLMYGGGQERSLRPGTVAVPLAVGLGLAVELMVESATEWEKKVRDFRQHLMSALAVVPFEINGDQERTAPHICNVSFNAIDSEALIVALKDVAAVATGSACTSSSYTPSHVLMGMGLSEDRINSSIRMSWWSDTDPGQLEELSDVLARLS